jgi:hypothetical protein
LYFSEISMSFYEFCKFKGIFGIFKRITISEKGKTMNSIGPDSGPRPQGSLAGSLLRLAGIKAVAAQRVSPTQGRMWSRLAQANATEGWCARSGTVLGGAMADAV